MRCSRLNRIASGPPGAVDRRRLASVVVAVWLWACCAPALAHKSSDAYLQLRRAADGTVSLRVDVALRDLDVALDIDADGDGKLVWREVRAAGPAIEAYLRARVQVAGCPLGAATHALEQRVDGAYAAVTFAADCTLDAVPAIRYTVMSDVDPTHRGIARIQLAGDAPPVLRVLDPTHPARLDPVVTAALPSSPASSASAASAASAAGVGVEVDGAMAAGVPPAPGPVPSAGAAPPGSADGSDGGTRRLGQFLREGVHHILSGYDHILFLLCLLLPSVLRRTPGGWVPVARLREAVLPVAAIVTAFTLAHSITLGLAASKLVSLSPAFIEPSIAVTIVLAALDNLVPIFRGRRAVVTFAFGLIHGFGFAGVLAELDLPTAEFAWALLTFNLGIELGQLTIVTVAVGVLYAVRARRGYVPWVLRGGSLVAIAIATAWFVERTANVVILPTW